VHFYQLAGLSVASEIAFPGAVDAPAVDHPDVTIRQDATPPDLSPVIAAGPNWTLSDGAFLLRVPGVARFLAREGRSIDFELEGEATIDDARAFLWATAFGILLHQRGCPLLHASAVAVGGGAVLFCGASGAGKSTLAAALAQRGHAFVTDDFCAIALDAAGGPPTVLPDGRLLKLWAQSIDKLGLDAQRGIPVRNRLQKFHVDPGEVAPAAMPIRAVYALHFTKLQADARIRPMNFVDAAAVLGNHAFRPHLVRRLRQDGLYLRAAAAIAGAAGVHLLERPLDLDQLADTVTKLEAHWAELGFGAS